MYIKYKDMYRFEISRYFTLDRMNQGELYWITMFLNYGFSTIRRCGVLNFIEKYKYGMLFEDVNLNIDNENDLVYFSESYYTYENKPTTPEIEELLEKEDFIQLCKIGFLDYVVMTKENFIHLLLAWDKIINQLPPFALLYLDDKNWYDVLPFDSQEAMEKFVADHTKIENVEK